MKNANMVAKKKCFTPFFLEQEIIANAMLGLLTIFSAMNSYGILMKAIDPSQNNVFKCIKLICRIIKETNYIAIPLLFKM